MVTFERRNVREWWLVQNLFFLITCVKGAGEVIQRRRGRDPKAPGKRSKGAGEGDPKAPGRAIQRRRGGDPKAQLYISAKIGISLDPCFCSNPRSWLYMVRDPKVLASFRVLSGAESYAYAD